MYNSSHTFKVEDEGKRVKQLAKINPYLPQKNKKAANQIEGTAAPLRKMQTYGS